MVRAAAIVVLALVIVTCQFSGYAKERIIERLDVTSSAFKEGEMIPKRYTRDGDNISPGISWSKPPIGAKSIAIICEDPDAITGIWTHWVAFNIPNKSGGLAENVPPRKAFPDGMIQGINDFKKTGYDGPHPPFGIHRYYFRVYALDTEVTDVGADAAKEDLLMAMQGNILAEGFLMGRYPSKD